MHMHTILTKSIKTDIEKPLFFHILRHTIKFINLKKNYLKLNDKIIIYVQ